MFHKDCISIDVYKGSILPPLKLDDEYSNTLEKRKPKASTFVYRHVNIGSTLLKLGVDIKHIVDRHWPTGTKIPGIFTSYFSMTTFDNDEKVLEDWVFATAENLLQNYPSAAAK